MRRYLFKRGLLLIPTLIGITLITYLVVRLAPGDYSTIKMGVQGNLKVGSVNSEILEAEKKLYGLDKPLILGYASWLSKAVRLDFGKSRKDHRPVLERIKEALPITITLNIIAMIIIYAIAIPMGIISAVKKDSLFDRGSSLFLFLLYSLPSFWVALLLLMLFGSGEYLNIFPLAGLTSDWLENPTFLQSLGDKIWHIVLPIVTLTYGGFAFLSRYTRANVLEVINHQYITTARAKGLSSKRVIVVHVFRNSLVSLVTLMASLLPGLFGGSVIVESIFSIPGIGFLGFEAIQTRDIPVVMAVMTISAVLTLVGILISDLMYAVVDPRIKLEGKI